MLLKKKKKKGKEDKIEIDWYSYCGRLRYWPQFFIPWSHFLTLSLAIPFALTDGLSELTMEAEVCNVLLQSDLPSCILVTTKPLPLQPGSLKQTWTEPTAWSSGAQLTASISQTTANLQTWEYENKCFFL